MKHLLLFTLACSVALFGSAQFSRSLRYTEKLNLSFQCQVVPAANNGTELITVGKNTSSDSVFISTATLNAGGDLTAETKFFFPASVASLTYVMVSGVVDLGNERTVGLTVTSGTTIQYLKWIKFNKTTGNLISELTDTTAYKIGFMRSISVGNELVSYQIRSSGGLERIAVDATTLASVNREVVNAAITSSGSQTTLIQNRTMGTVLNVSGEEVLYYIGGHSVVTFYKRTAPNNYSSTVTTESISNCGEIVQATSGNFIVTANSKRYLFSPTFSLITSENNFNTPSFSKLIAYNGTYQYLTVNTGSPKTIWREFDENLQLIDSVEIPLNLKLSQITLVNNLPCVAGIVTTNGLTYDYSGADIVGMPAIVVSNASLKNIFIEEYRHRFVHDNLHADLGLGPVTFIMTPNNTCAVSYNDSVSIVYHSSDQIIGKTTNAEILGFNSSSGGENYFESQELPGPYTTPGEYDELIEAKYNRGFYVSLEMIEAHIDSLHSGSANYVAPHGIREWPAHGNAGIGQAADLAGFVDISGNGIYEPYLGDYPKIYGDRCFLSITHINPNIVGTNNIETHSYVYTIACDTSDLYDNVLFRKVFYHSRTEDFDSLFVIGFADCDLGNYNDDYTGSNVELGLIYTYNADDYDEPNAGRPGFNDKATAFGMMQLRGAKLKSDTLDNQIGVLPGECINGLGFNDAIQDNEYYTMEAAMFEAGTGAPGYSFMGATTPEQAFNSGMGIFNGGEHITFGGFGYGVTAINAKFMCPGASDPLLYGTGGIDPDLGVWSEEEPMGSGTTSNPGGDRRMLLSPGSSSVAQDDFIEMDQAYVFVIDSSGLNQTFGGIKPVLFDKCSAIKSAFAVNNGPCGAVFSTVDEDLKTPLKTIPELKVFPNPGNGLVHISGLADKAQIEVYDLTGKLVLKTSTTNPTETIHLEEINGNIFLLRVATGGTVFQSKIVKY